MRIRIAIALLVAACSSPSRPRPAPDAASEVEVCHFESGRPCRADTVCIGIQGAECNYPTCVDGELTQTAAGCGFGEVPPVEGGPFDCDPTLIVRKPGPYTPPLPCPLGSL